MKQTAQPIPFFNAWRWMITVLPLFGAVLHCLAAGPVHAETLDAILNHSKVSNPEPIRQTLEEKDATAKIIVHYRRPSSLSGNEPLNTDVRRKTVRKRIRTAREAFIKGIEDDGIKSTHVRLKREFDYIPAVAATVSTSGLEALLAREDVEHIEPDLILHAHTAQGIPLLQAEVVRGAYSGNGVSIAICDTGIDYTHSRLGGGGFPNGKVIGGYDYGGSNPYRESGSDADPMDTMGHGTRCAGIAAGDLPGDGDYIGGIAPAAKLYAVKISPNGVDWAYESDMVAGWEWCVTNKEADPNNPILVISTSFGGGGYNGQCDDELSTMTQAAANAVSAGITVFASSGNDGYCGQIAWPACISHVISVGAVFDSNIGGWGFCVDPSSCADNLETEGYCTTSTGTIAWAYSTAANQVTPYSNVSEQLDLFAPSHFASTPTIGDVFNTQFGGTSAACPYAAGLAAVIQSAAKASTGSFLTQVQVKARLTGSGDPITYTPAGITKPRPNLYATDIDGDGMPSGWEIDYFGGITPDGSDDFDSDALTNLEEYQLGTLPDEPDSEADGMTDGWEVGYGLDPLSDDSALDVDRDQLDNLTEFTIGTQPDNPDTDGDGSKDGDEINAGSNPLDPQSYPVPVNAAGEKSLALAVLLLLGIGVAAKVKTPVHGTDVYKL